MKWEEILKAKENSLFTSLRKEIKHLMNEREKIMALLNLPEKYQGRFTDNKIENLRKRLESLLDKLLENGLYFKSDKGKEFFDSETKKDLDKLIDTFRPRVDF